MYSCQNNEKREILSEALRRICNFSTDKLPFEVILHKIIREFALLKIDVVRSALCGIINDVNYDIDTITALANLFDNDERRSQEKYILQAIAGCNYNDTRCGTCHKSLMAGSDIVTTFPCGHTFHQNDECLPAQMCPICNPEVRLDKEQVEQPTKRTNMMQTMRELRMFEHRLKPRESGLPYVEKKGNIQFVGSVEVL
ncbi:vacuolar protein sorting-associated protein 8 isoform X2 [Histomonas meleagridis]|uniref:vacuolar protein sorting-associated protein 8-like isoform X2 n=1 Tax=Histomonas meleagridis TaxID=135588 RepID=UPI003559DFA8|nr:vacuolar protein sorting-associated protein 8 isoform X2 [Histomonas meleagridis]KAH0800602.1 vacuolar protein sorting-associated protein 8-like isoform X2 [Histomonas meleagridis]